MLDIDRLPDTRTNGRTRTTSRLPTVVVVQTRMTWRERLISPAGGRRSLLRGQAALSAPMRRATRSRRAPAGGEIGLAVERRENGAAHQGRAAQAGQDRAGKPLHRDAAAIDQPPVPPSTESGGSLPRSMARLSRSMWRAP